MNLDLNKLSKLNRRLSEDRVKGPWWTLNWTGWKPCLGSPVMSSQWLFIPAKEVQQDPLFDQASLNESSLKMSDEDLLNHASLIKIEALSRLYVVAFRLYGVEILTPARG